MGKRSQFMRQAALVFALALLPTAVPASAADGAQDTTRRIVRTIYFGDNSDQVTEYSHGVIGNLLPDLTAAIAADPGAALLLLASEPEGDAAAAELARRRARAVRGELVGHGIAAARIGVGTTAASDEPGKPSGKVQIWLASKSPMRTSNDTAEARSDSAPPPIVAPAAPDRAPAQAVSRPATPRRAPRPSSSTAPTTTNTSAPTARSASSVPWWLSEKATPPLEPEFPDSTSLDQDLPPPPSLPPLPPELADLDRPLPPPGAAAAPEPVVAPPPPTPSVTEIAVTDAAPMRSPVQSVTEAAVMDSAPVRETSPADQVVRFGAGSRELDPAAMSTLDRAANDWREPLEAHPDWNVEVLGVASAQEYSAPRSLADARAALVRFYLSTRGLARTRLHIVIGVEEPADGRGPRVELRLVKR